MLAVAGSLNSSLSVANNHVSSAWGHTRSDLFGTKYMWAIDNFSFRKEAVGTAVKSPVFTLALPDKEIELIIMVYPSGESTSITGYVSAYVQVLTKDISINAKAKLGIVTRYGETELYKSSSSTLLAQYAKLGSGGFVPRSNLFETNHNYCITSDRLTIYCEFSVVRESVNIRCANFKGSSLARTVSEDIQELFETQNFSDFDLLVHGRHIKVHKVVLAARCPIFAAIMSETKTKMEIPDLSYDAVVEFLRYIYTGQVENIDNISQDLLLASIKYGMEGLKPICFENIISKMDVANGADVLVFAHENKLQELKKAALDYFKKHSKAIMKTDGFEHLKISHPQLVLNDLFETLAL
ncbi:SPOPL.2 family protein [Megaselia abdita]